MWVPVVSSFIHLRFVDGLGCPSINRKYRDRDHRVTTRRVRLATLFQGVDPTVWTRPWTRIRFIATRLSLDGTDDQTIELASASVAKRSLADAGARHPLVAEAVVLRSGESRLNAIVAPGE